jgi:hypothetical protein
MSRPLIILVSSILVACPPPEDTQQPDDTQGSEDTQPIGDTGPRCEENAAGELPEGVVWLETGASGNRYTIADGGLMANYNGYEGTYDLNTEEVYAAASYNLTAPATVYGARVVWGHIPQDDIPAELFLWRDFSSDFYAFDIWEPYGSYTRCVGVADEYQEVTYVFPEPVEVTQPLPVFAGYHRPEVTDEDGDGQPDYRWPEIVYDAPVVGGYPDDPYIAGVRFPNVDTTYYYNGQIMPFYGFEIELAVVFDDSLAPEDKPFQDPDVLRASSRVAWGDYDGDGDDDLMTNGPTLYRNQGDGSFQDVTATAIPGGAGNYAGGGVWGDYDGDGCLDYFGQGTSYGAGEVLLHNNCDGTFTDLWAESGIDDTQDDRDCDGDGEPEHSPTEGSGWADYDGDGLLDLYLANYECSSSHDYYENYDDRLFRNNGDGTFTDASEEADIETSNQAGRGVTPGDYDIDGDVDIFVSNYRLDKNFFYQNQGEGVLEEIAGENGTRGEYNMDWRSYGHTIGSVFGDIDNDGDFDMVHANLEHPFYYHFSNLTMVLINDGSGQFVDEAEARGIYYRETASNPVLFDADNDGDLDLFITNVYPDRDSDFYVNDGTGHFQLQNWESGLVQQNGWGAAAADYDNDGDVDLIAYDLFRNDLDNDHHWLQVRAVGLEGNTAALGAVVQVDAGDLSQIRMVSGGSGTTSQDSQTQHFGLGARDSVDSVTVYFPYQDAPVTITGVAVDQRVWIYSDGTHTTGWAPSVSR